MTESISQQQIADRSCRLCGATTREKFALDVLQKYRVAYLECDGCHSLQTETPYWTSEAYRSNLATLDTGAAQRNLANLTATFITSRVLRLNNILDFGGGDGLLCRLLRDYGVNCFVNDKYAAATYAQSFAHPNFSQPDILLAFEVFEHFENPRADLERLFKSSPRVLITSTGVFSGQNSSWWYLTPETGQHLFFYSERALAMIADERGYDLLFCSGYILFLRSSLATRINRGLLKFLLRKLPLRLTSALMRLLPTPGVWKDFNFLRGKK